MPLVKSKLVCASRLSQISGVENAKCDESKVSAASLLLIILICVEKVFFPHPRFKGCRAQASHALTVNLFVFHHRLSAQNNFLPSESKLDYSGSQFFMKRHSLLCCLVFCFSVSGLDCLSFPTENRHF